MFCCQCGTALEANTSYCTQCGSPVEGTPQPQQTAGVIGVLPQVVEVKGFLQSVRLELSEDPESHSGSLTLDLDLPWGNGHLAQELLSRVVPVRVIG